jgi:hypothetical protein
VKFIFSPEKRRGEGLGAVGDVDLGQMTQLERGVVQAGGFGAFALFSLFFSLQSLD